MRKSYIDIKELSILQGRKAEEYANAKRYIVKKIGNKKFHRLKILVVNFFLLGIALNYSSCKKFVETEAPPVLSGLSVFGSDATAISVMTGLYGKMSSYSFNAPVLGSISKFAGLSADELDLVANSANLFAAYYKNSLTQTYDVKIGAELWNNIYGFIYTCNVIIQGVEKSVQLSPSVKAQLLGEAKFSRAFLYFYLTNLFGDVPLIKGTDFEVNRLAGRSLSTSIYNQIISDLKDAQSLLSNNYLDGSLLKTTTERVRPTKWVATALLARAYLFQSRWEDAEIEASKIIEQTVKYSMPELKNVFLKNSLEAIWQLQPVNVNQNTPDALGFLIPSSGLSAFNVNVYLSKRLIDSFELGDNRKVQWTKSYVNSVGTYNYAYKYKVTTIPSTTPPTSPSEYMMVFRLAEQFLIRAEARAQKGNLNGSSDDLSVVRQRAGLLPKTGLSKEDLLNSILRERKMELFTEWGHRWLDLKRVKAIDAVMPKVSLDKGGKWESYKQLYPIPFDDIQRNPSLIQTNGY